MIDRLKNTTVTIRRSTESVDEYGQPTLTWADYLTDVKAHVFQASAFQRFASAKTTDFFSHQMICDALDITTADRVVNDGLTYKVVAVNKPPFGSHLVCNLERCA